MITVENVTYTSALDAATAAGIGGRIRSAMTGINYIVSVDSSSERFVLTREGDPHTSASVVEFSDHENNYSVVEVGDLELKDEEAQQDTTTVREFFEGLRRYTYFTVDSYEMLFYGWEYEEGTEQRYVVAFDAEYGDIQKFRASQLNELAHNSFQVVEENGRHKRAPRIIQHFIGERMDYSNRLQRITRHRDELSLKYHEAHSDLETLNTKINEYAEETHMCGDYERRIFGWNKDLKFQLLGRMRTYYVPVSIPSIATDKLEIPVEAQSPELAKRMVENLTPSEILNKLAGIYSESLDKLKVEVSGDAYH